MVAALEDRKTDVSASCARRARRRRSGRAARAAGGDFRRLPAFLAELEPYMSRLGDLTEAQTPVLRDLQSASGELDTFLTRLRPFAGRGRARRSARWASLGGRAAAPCGRPRRSSPSCAGWPRTLPGSRSRCASSSRRSTTARGRWSPTRRAAPARRPRVTRPHTHVEPRRLHRHGGDLELRFYWQTLSTNALDDVGHVLRLGLVNRVLDYQVKPSEATLDKCNQFLGPTQPGVTTPDPTRGGASRLRDNRVGPGARPADSRASKPLGSLHNPALDYLLGK